MVSSTYTELLDHRRAIKEIMSGQRLLPIAMEDDPPCPTRPLRYRRPASRQGRLVRILGMGLGTATANGRRMLNVLGSVAQFEREVMPPNLLISHAAGMAATDFGLNEHPRSFRTPRAAISAVTARRLNFPPLGFFASTRLRQRYDFGSLLSVALAPLDPFAGRLALALTRRR
jgi:hypothetical protein